MLNYETVWMSRAQLVSATYDAAEALNRLKLKYGRIDKARGEKVAARIVQARGLKARLDAMEQEGATDPEAVKLLKGEVNTFSISTVCDKQELFWKRHLVNFRLMGIAKIVLAYLRDAVGHPVHTN